MPTIKLAQPWTYRTPLATIDFAAGEHEVSDEIAAVAPTPPPSPVTEPEETADGDRTAKARAPRRSDPTED